MTDPPLPPITRRRGRMRLLLGAPLAIALALGMAAVMPGIAQAASRLRRGAAAAVAPTSPSATAARPAEAVAAVAAPPRCRPEP